jgi:ParB family chromosome partitioning protein
MEPKPKPMKVINIPVSKLKLSKKRWKREKHDVDELAESMRRHGVLQPVIARKKNGKMYVVAGAHRLRAAKKAGLTEMPVAVIDVDDDEAAMRSIEENVKRYAPNKVERHDAIVLCKKLWEQKNGKPKRGGDRRSAKAKAKRRTKGAPRTFEKDAAKKLGVSRTTINKSTNREEKLDPKVLKAWRDGDISDDQADQLTKYSRPKQRQLLPTVINQKRDETRQMVRTEKPPSKKKRSNSVPELEKRLSRAAEYAKKMNTELDAASSLVETIRPTALAYLAPVFLPEDLEKTATKLHSLRCNLALGN